MQYVSTFPDTTKTKGVPLDNQIVATSMEFGSEHRFRGIYERVTTLSHQDGVKVLLFNDKIVLKVGDRVLPSEEITMRLVKEHTDIPVPEVYLATYFASEGRLAMSVIPGTPLKNVWDNLG